MEEEKKKKKKKRMRRQSPPSLSTSRIRRDVVVTVVFIVFALVVVALVISGVDSDSLCDPPRNIGLYRPIGVGSGSVFSRMIAFTMDVDPETVLPLVDDVLSLYNRTDSEYSYSQPRPSKILWAWLRFLEHDLVEVRRTNDTQRDDYLLDKKNNSQQINYASPFLDLSQIYGNTAQAAHAIRRDDGTGKLITNFSSTILDAEDDILPMFELLDERHGDDLLVDALYTLFVREHNYWCDRIFASRPHLLGYDYYNIARHIVIAEMQAITYRTVLPLLIGDTINVNVACFSNAEDPDSSYPLEHYVRKVSVYNEFATAVLPVYLSMEDGESRGNASVNDDYLSSHGVADLLVNASRSHARKRDLHIVDELLDLAAQRLASERDHQIPPYQLYYNHYMHDAHVLCQRFSYDRPLCAHVEVVFGGEHEHVDLFTGVLLERKLSSGLLLGNVAAHIFASQFTHLKRNDHYFYLWDDVVKPYLSEIHHVSLAKIILRNTGVIISELRPNVFEV